MNIMPCAKQILFLGIASLGLGLPRLAIAATPTPVVAMLSLAGTATLPTTGLTHLSDKTLGEIRGGFSVPGNPNISVDFGFSIQTVVNGSLVQNLTGEAGNITQNISQAFNAGASTVKTTTPTSSTFTTTVPASTQTGTPLATTVANTVGNSGVSTLIQNQANSRIIQETRTLNLDITGLQTQLVNSAQASRLMRALTSR